MCGREHLGLKPGAVVQGKEDQTWNSLRQRQGGAAGGQGKPKRQDWPSVDN